MIHPPAPNPIHQPASSASPTPRRGGGSIVDLPARSIIGILAFTLGGVPPAQGQRAVKPEPAIDAIFRVFAHRDVVLLGEIHWNVAQHEFIQRLLRDPRLPDVVRDVAVEFGNALYQPLIDRFVADEDVPSDSMELVWRNTTGVLAWDRPMYGDIFRTVRDINRQLPHQRRVRVVALDPPIEWREVMAADQFPRRWGYRDPVWSDVFEREVLSKGHKALVIAGGLHILRRDPPDFAPKTFDRVGFGDALAQRHASRTFRIYPAVGSGALGAAVGGWPAGTLGEVGGTSLGAQSGSILWPSTVTMLRRVNGKIEPYTLKPTEFPPVDSLIDAILFYGADDSKAPWPLDPFRDSSYVAELRRRNDLLLPIFGQDQRQLIDSLARAASQPHRVRITFLAETPADSLAADEYRRIWAENEKRVVAAMERISGLSFVTAAWADTAISVRVLEAPANSGYRAGPMRLRSSYPSPTKLATLVHELGHRIQTDLFRREEEEHEYLFLWLYDVWVALEGQAWADEQVALERRRGDRYVHAWDRALALTAGERAERWRAVVSERAR